MGPGSSGAVRCSLGPWPTVGADTSGGTAVAAGARRWAAGDGVGESNRDSSQAVAAGRPGAAGGDLSAAVAAFAVGCRGGCRLRTRRWKGPSAAAKSRSASWGQQLATYPGPSGGNSPAAGSILQLERPPRLPAPGWAATGARVSGLEVPGKAEPAWALETTALRGPAPAGQRVAVLTSVQGLQRRLPVGNRRPGTGVPVWVRQGD